LSIFLRALENMAEHHREMMHRPVLLLQDANYQQLNCQRSIPAAARQPSPMHRRQTALSEQRPNLRLPSR
jgi:hypothetical protein